MEMYKVKCPECGKDVLTYDPHKPEFCGKICKTNHKYNKKFRQDEKNI